MQLPLGFNDFSLWLAITAIILLATSELLNPRYGKTGLTIERKRLRKTALVIGALFLVTVAIRIYMLIVTI